MGFCLTLFGLWLLLFSQDFDETGLSRPWPFILGSMTTYLALSQTITAVMHVYLLSITSEVKASRSAGLESPAPFTSLGSTPLLVLIGMGAVVWGLITYVAPVVTCLKSPFRGGRYWLLTGYYVALQVPIYWVYARVWHLEYVPAGQPVDMLSLFALQFVQPLL